MSKESEITQAIEKFETTREQYMESRNEQHKIIKNYLSKEAGFTVPSGGGRGSHHYGKNRLTKEYDFSNWNWVDCEKEGKRLLVSLQPFDIDPKKNNYHVLTDRIGIYIYAPGSTETSDAIERMLTTDIDLPMDEIKLEKLASLLNKIIHYQKEIELIKMELMKRNRQVISDMEADEELKCLVPVRAENDLQHQLFAL